MSVAVQEAPCVGGVTIMSPEQIDHTLKAKAFYRGAKVAIQFCNGDGRPVGSFSSISCQGEDMTILSDGGQIFRKEDGSWGYKSPKGVPYTLLNITVPVVASGRM